LLWRTLCSPKKLFHQKNYFTKKTISPKKLFHQKLFHPPGFRMGGEPSGHIIFCETKDGVTKLIDDPFVTYLKLLGSVFNRGGNLDNLLDQLYMVVPEVFCARKPDSRAGKGLTLKEKAQLELWDVSDSSMISQYAIEFIPVYVEMYALMVADVFQIRGSLQIDMSPEWIKLREANLDLPETGWDMPLAEISYQNNQKLNVFLYLDPRSWAGPEVIRIGFRGGNNRDVLLGEGVFRNSGTSPKNAGYHKLWPENPWTGDVITENALRSCLTHLAEERAEFTNFFVMKNFRNSDSMS